MESPVSLHHIACKILESLWALNQKAITVKCFYANESHMKYWSNQFNLTVSWPSERDWDNAMSISSGEWNWQIKLCYLFVEGPLQKLIHFTFPGLLVS